MAKEFLKVRSGVAIKPNSAPSDPDNGDLYYDSSTDSFNFRQGGVWTPLTATPVWTKYTVTHTALQAASTSNSVTLFTLPSKNMIHQVVVKHSVAFAGTGILTYTLSIGTLSNPVKFTAAFDVKQTVSDDAAYVTQDNEIESFSSGTNIKLTATSTGANLNLSTAGSVDVWVMTSALP